MMYYKIKKIMKHPIVLCVVRFAPCAQIGSKLAQLSCDEPSLVPLKHKALGPGLLFATWACVLFNKEKNKKKNPHIKVTLLEIG